MAAVPSRGRASEIEPEGLGAAFDVAGLYSRHGRRVFGYCLARLRNREEAEDAAQSTFLYALSALRRGVVPASEATWLITIAQNVCLNRWHSSRRRRALEVARDPHDLGELVAGRFSERFDVDELGRALQALPEQQRRAILLREWQGLSYVEIQEELGLGKAAVETLIFRARRSLAEALRDQPQTKPSPRVPSRRVRGLDLASLLSGLKSMLTGGGAVAKVAIGVAALATVGVGVDVGVERHVTGGNQPTPVPQRTASVPALAKQHASPRSVASAPAVPRLVAPKTAAARAALPEALAPSVPPVVHHPGAKAAAPQPTAVVSVAPMPVPAPVGAVARTADDTAEAVANTVGAIAKPVTDTVDTVVPDTVSKPATVAVNGIVAQLPATAPEPALPPVQVPSLPPVVLPKLP